MTAAAESVANEESGGGAPEGARAAYAVVIANWNGEAFIERCLGSVLAALRHAGLEAPVLVVDDASEDGSVALIEAAFPTVGLLRLTQNVGFGQAVNRAMAALGAERVFLLNNDLALQADFFDRLRRAWEAWPAPGERGELFAIGAQTRDWGDTAPNHAGQRAIWRDGMIVQEGFAGDALAPTDFFQAGACLIDRAKFLALGGFAGLYHPAYWEDYDLAYAALRRGWVNLYEPGAVAFHWGKGSMRRRYGTWGVSLLLRRNHLLFIWANLIDGSLLRRHLRALTGLIAGDRPGPEEAGWGRALLAALGRLPAALRLRRARLGQPGAARSDRALLHLK